MRFIALFVGAMLFSGVFAQPPFRDINYVDLVKNPDGAKRDREFRAYLLGVAYGIGYEYSCQTEDDAVLKDPDKMKTSWAFLYLEGSTGIGGMHYDAKSGDVLYRMFTKHEHCTKLNLKQENLSRD